MGATRSVESRSGRPAFGVSITTRRAESLTGWPSENAAARSSVASTVIRQPPPDRHSRARNAPRPETLDDRDRQSRCGEVCIKAGVGGSEQGHAAALAGAGGGHHRRGEELQKSSPFRNTPPWSGVSSPASTRSRVVLPDPGDPSTVRNSPSRASRKRRPGRVCGPSACRCGRLQGTWDHLAAPIIACMRRCATGGRGWMPAPAWARVGGC